MIGDATLVALSEATHGAAEPHEFRNALFQELVRFHGFTAVAIESGIAESHALHRYVLGDPGDLDAILPGGITWKFDRFPQNRALIDWMRAYNSDPRHGRKINFYGFDVPGAPSRARPYFSYETSLGKVMSFLQRVDKAAADVFDARLGRLINEIRFHPRMRLDAVEYGRLTAAERDSITASLSDLVTWMERNEAKYIAAASADEYAWASRSALGALQLDAWLRQVPLDWTPDELAGADDESASFFSVASDIRDRSMADNVEWICRQEGPAGKVLLFASRYHLSAAPVRVSWHPHRRECTQEVAATYLRRRFGSKLVTIGNLIGGGEATSLSSQLGRAPAKSVDGLAGELDAPWFALDLRTAPAECNEWLDAEQEFVSGPQLLRTAPRPAFDVLWYVAAVTPAIANDAA